MTEVSCKSEPLKRRTVPEALRVVSESGVEVFQKILDCWGVGRRVSLRMICKFSVKISVVLRFGLPDRAETCDGCCDSSVRFSLHFVSHFPRHYRYCFRSWRKSVFADNLQVLRKDQRCFTVRIACLRWNVWWLLRLKRKTFFASCL